MATTVTETIGTAGGRDYSTISGWEAGTDNDLVTADEVRVGECYNDSEFDERPVFFGSTTDATRFRRLTVASADRHDGTPLSGARIRKATDTNNQIVFINESYFQLEWIELTVDSSAYGGSEWTTFDAIGRGSGGVDGMKVRHVLAWDFDLNVSSWASFLRMRGSGAVDREISGCVVKADTANGNRLLGVGGDGTDLIYGNTVVGGTEGIGDNGSGTLHVRNNVCVGATTADFNVTVGAGDDTSHNASSDTSAPGPNSVTGITPSNEFEDYTSASPNWSLHLASGSSLEDAGVDLGDIEAAIDILGFNRHTEGVTWDIGAHELEGESQTFDVSLTEGIGVGDVPTAVLELSAALSETVGMGDVPEIGLVLDATLQETLGLSDAYSADLIFGLKEELGLSDQLDVVLEAIAEAVETVGLGDSVTAQLVAAVSLTEGFSLDDVLAAAREIPVSNVEGLALSDLLEVVLDLGGEATEGSGIGDTVEAVVVTLGNLSKHSLETTVRDESCWQTPVNDDEKLTSAVQDGMTFTTPVPGADT